jgi:hypothetical protein
LREKSLLEEAGNNANLPQYCNEPLSSFVRIEVVGNVHTGEAGGEENVTFGGKLTIGTANFEIYDEGWLRIFRVFEQGA